MSPEKRPESTTFDDFLEEQLTDPKFRAEYENLGPRFDAVTGLIRARLAAGLTQTELARRMGVSQGVLSRLESAWHSPRLETLAAAARALGYTLEVRFKKAVPARDAQKAAARDARPGPARNARPVAKPPAHKVAARNARKVAPLTRQVAEPSRPVYRIAKERRAATSRPKPR